MKEELLEWMKLKHISRQGWVRHGISNPESVASHSWSMGVLALTLCPKHLNLEKILKMCLLHDLAEVVIGDITPDEDILNKAVLEHSAFQKIASRHLPFFEEYEDGQTEEAQFVKCMDKLDMALQSLVYEREFDISLEQFRESAGMVLKGTQFEDLYV